MTRIALFALIGALLTTASAAFCPAGEPETWKFTDIQETVHEPFSDKSTRAIVLVFISTDCPIANGYHPLLRRLEKQHAENGVRFYMVHPRPGTSVERAREHADDYAIAAPVIIDEKQRISRRVGAKVTPQAFVFRRDEAKPVYQGRIDDRYANYGKKRNVTTANELADALAAVVAGRRPATAKTKAIGCFISYDE